MFSQLGPLFKTTLRQAESADTRLEIRRDEKQDQGKKRDFDQTEDDTDALWMDTTTVSVDSLRVFLIGFLQTRGDATQAEKADMATIQAAPPETLTPTTNIAARAVKAYAATAAHNQPPPPDITPDAEEEIDLVSLLKADELRTMHQLIHELDILSRKGVQTLTIEKADTFLESLVQAVRLEKAKP